MLALGIDPGTAICGYGLVDMQGSRLKAIVDGSFLTSTQMRPQDWLLKILRVLTDIIKKFSEEMPEITVYAGIDQYRSSMKEEEYRIRRKQLAGAKGFFTQPFFDMRYLEMYADLLDGLDIYWGVSPVLSERSVSYWRNKNNVIFPKDFEPTLEWNIEFASKVIDFARKHNHNVYLMPIKAKIMPYLEGVFAK